MGSAGGSRNGGGGGGDRSPNNTTTLTLGTDGNFFRVRGTADIERVAVGPRGGTQVGDMTQATLSACTHYWDTGLDDRLCIDVHGFAGPGDALLCRALDRARR
jgi:hypothetical protein